METYRSFSNMTVLIISSLWKTVIDKILRSASNFLLLLLIIIIINTKDWTL